MILIDNLATLGICLLTICFYKFFKYLSNGNARTEHN